MALLKEVHGGRDLCGPMFKSRIVEQMCREPDEESSFYSDLVRGDMRVMIYNLPGGSRLRFIMLPSSDAVVGWKIIPASTAARTYMWAAREPKLTRSGDWSLPKVVLCDDDHRFHRASAAALAISRRRASCDAERSVDGFDGPVDSRSKRGNRRGNHGWLAASKSFMLSDLLALDG